MSTQSSSPPLFPLAHSLEWSAAPLVFHHSQSQCSISWRLTFQMGTLFRAAVGDMLMMTTDRPPCLCQFIYIYLRIYIYTYICTIPSRFLGPCPPFGAVPAGCDVHFLCFIIRHIHIHIHILLLLEASGAASVLFCSALLLLFSSLINFRVAFSELGAAYINFECCPWPDG